MSDPSWGEVAPAQQAGGAAGDVGTADNVGERARVDSPRGRTRRRALAAAGLVLAAVVVGLVATDPFAGSAHPGGGVLDNATATSLATVTRQSLSSQTQVGGTVGYAGASSIRVPSGTAPSAVSQTQQSVANADEMLSAARASLAADGEALANQRATLAAARAKEAVDCAGEGAAEAASSGSPSSGSPSSDGGSGLCVSDVQAVSADEQSSTAAAMKVKSDRAQVSSAQKSLASATASLKTERSSDAVYGQSSTFTKLPAVGRILKRGESLYEIGGHPVVLLYGRVVATRAFIAGMSPGSDLAELNANLDALGYGGGLTGEEFSAGTAAAIRAFQAAHGLRVTGSLLLGSVVFEPGPVRVTSVTATVGAPVVPGPVLGITSTARQIKIALNAAQQASVKVGDAVTITLPDNQTTPGRISHVSRVATSSSSRPGEEEGTPTIEVDVTPTDPAATGQLDQAPVNVSITTETVKDALTVPIDSLLALAGGGYAIEVAEGGVRRLEAVSLGLFDDADGLVQVSGQGVQAGQRVVVPQT